MLINTFHISKAQELSLRFLDCLQETFHELISTFDFFEIRNISEAYLIVQSKHRLLLLKRLNVVDSANFPIEHVSASRQSIFSR